MSSHLLSACPCQSQDIFERCCQPILLGVNAAITAEQLMRSRYTAYYLLGNASSGITQKECVQYLIDTHHPEYRSADLAADLLSGPPTEWCSLRIINMEEGGATDVTGLVEYAFYRRGTSSEYGQMHEASSFIKQGDHWLYTTGEQLAAMTLSRNNVCWCGSQQKLKRCHPE
ncbi:MAG: YchJ family metal-binding protein [Pseudomonadota bacterium]